MLISLAMMIAGLQNGGEGAPRRAMANLAELISDADYPSDAIARGAQGRVSYTLSIDPTGVARDCRITVSSGDASLDRTTCELLLARARFRPALDHQGRPVSDTVASSVRWVLPDPELFAFKPFLHAITIHSSSTRVIRCTVREHGRVGSELSRDECREELGEKLMEEVESMPLDAEITFAIQFTPEGAATLAHGSKDGRLHAEVVLNLTIAPDGRISSCQVASSRGSAGSIPPHPAADKCPGREGEPVFVSATQNNQVRRGTMAQRAYIRIGKAL